MSTTRKEDAVFDALLDVTEQLSEQGITPAEVARATAAFLVQLSFDCAPTAEHATHLILSAIAQLLERNIDED